MSKSFLHVAEFTGSTTALPAVQLPPSREQLVEITGKSVLAEPFGEYTQVVRLMADAPCAVAVGTDPEAQASSLPLPARAPEYFYVPPGHRLAVISNG